MARKQRAAVAMAVVALIFVVLHFITGWQAFVDEAASQGQSAAWSEYVVVWARDTFENLQSEFWQLAVQFALLAGVFRFIGIQAYEEDTEEIKAQLRTLRAQLEDLKAHQENAATSMR